MSRTALYKIVSDTPERLIIKDVGHDQGHPTITNDAEEVVRQLAPGLGKRRLLYIDSDGQMDELAVRDGRFAGFLPGGR